MARFRGTYPQGAALWRAADFGTPPPALSWRQHEPIPADPVAATNTAENELRDRGLITRHGPRDELWELLAIFAQAEVEADLKYTPSPRSEIRALVAIRGHSAARWTIDQDGIEIETVRSTSALRALVSALPEARPVSGKPVSLRTTDLRQAAAATEEAEDVEQAAISELRRAGVRSDDARKAVRMLSGGRTLKGQFGAAVYTGTERHRVRAERIIEVLDKVDGRVIRYEVGSNTTIAPGENALIVRALSGLIEDTHGGVSVPG